MSVAQRYRAFVCSHYRWYCAMSPRGLGWAMREPPASLAALQAVNAFSFFLPLWRYLPIWLAIAIAAVSGFAFYFVNRRIVEQAGLVPAFPGWSASVPSLRVFPAVYGYLAGTFALLAISIWGALRQAP